MTRFLTILLGVLGLAGCATAPPAPVVPYTGDPVIDGNAHLAVAPPKDRVLWQYRVAAAALRRGMWEEAEAKLDSALGSVAGLLSAAHSADAARSRRLFRSEADKPYIGEPYERVMANYYRGLVYWRAGEPDNARALFRTGQLIDSDTLERSYSGDYVLLDYLDGLVSARLGGDGRDALQRARQNARHPLPDYDREANVMVFVEYGQGPRKYAGGQHGEQLKFMAQDSKVRQARLTVAGRTVDLPPYDDLNFQATTRGGRVMDHILGNKAVFKDNTSAIGDVALAGAMATAAYGRGSDSDKAALALAAVGLVSKLASAATQTSADTRAWENLPQYLSFAALRLPPGEHAATLMFYDAAGQLVPGRTQSFTISVDPPDPSIGARSRPTDVVVFRSEVPN